MSVKARPFAFRELALLGVLSALTTVVSIASAILIHATGLIAVPGLAGFLVSLSTSVVVYVVLRKVPKFGSLTILAIVYALVLLVVGRPMTAPGVFIGGLIWSPVVAIVIYQGIKEVLGLVTPLLLGVTQSKLALVIMLITVLGGIIGALSGGVFGRSLMDRLAKSGVVR
jgi:hypothetical protein